MGGSLFPRPNGLSQMTRYPLRSQARRRMVRSTLAALAIWLLAGSTLARDPAVAREFRRLNPCPSTGKTTGPCPGWEADHAHAMCLGGRDEPGALHWLRVEDHRWKTRIDLRECRKLRRNAKKPAQ